MVSRVSLLLLVTGLFAAMWSTDSPDGRTPEQRQLARRASTPRWIPERTVGDGATRLRRLAGARRDTSMPLPVGIAAGTYLVVDQSGSTQRVMVTSCGSQSEMVKNQVLVDQYTVRDGARRWHFIRVENSTDAQANRPKCRSRAVTLR